MKPIFKKQTSKQKRENKWIVLAIVVLAVVCFLFYAFVFQSAEDRKIDWLVEAVDYCKTNPSDTSICVIEDSPIKFNGLDLIVRPKFIEEFSCDELILGYDVATNLMFKNKITRGYWLRFGRFTPEEFEESIERSCEIGSSFEDCEEDLDCFSLDKIGNNSCFDEKGKCVLPSFKIKDGEND